MSPRTVQRIADEAGIESPWDTTSTRQATVAARNQLRARRAALTGRMLDEVERRLDTMRRPYVAHAFRGKENTFNAATLEEPDAGALRNLAASAAVLFDKHLAADKHDAVSMLGRLADGLAATHR